jgi:hypothetical protein
LIDYVLIDLTILRQLGLVPKVAAKAGGGSGGEP